MAVFTPFRNGEYKVTIKLEGTNICNSPFRGVAIDGMLFLFILYIFVYSFLFLEFSPKIKEMAFSQDWVPETTQLYTLLSQRGISSMPFSPTNWNSL